MRETLYRALRAAVIFICHAALACVIVVCVWVVDQLIRLLGHDSTGMLLFGRVPLAYLFQTIDVVMIVLFGLAGAIEAAKELFR